ncbi:MAG: DUF308 domain-containing protein [gamma proteobacterium symbiont of Bathyaustriella thionipta]|nr:DUF308 domain-containing protein [gamma proteobacterium symbiont of Bathyaustriella thionipta]
MSLPLQIPAENLQGFIKNARRTGIVMLIIGMTGILLPNLISLTLNAFIGGLFLFSSAVLAYIAWQSHANSLSMWFKPFILFALALLILFHPGVLLAVLGLLLAVYFFLDGFSAVMLGLEIKPAGGWLFMLINGLLSLSLAVLVLISWPFSAPWIIGMLIGISFLFDGIGLLMIARQTPGGII